MIIQMIIDKAKHVFLVFLLCLKKEIEKELNFVYNLSCV